MVLVLIAAAAAAMAPVAQGLNLGRAAPISVSGTPSKASAAIPEAFVSYSIEFSSFPDFAGNSSMPNTFSDNLLNNIGNLTGTKPYIRVGGNTQDYALYDASQTAALIGIYDLKRSADYPTTVTIGKSFFDSYNTWPGVKFSHGFNLALATTAAGWQTLQATAPLACKALGGGKLLWWEYGNEPDLYANSGQGKNPRTGTWDSATYVSQWLNGTRSIKTQIQNSCPDMATDSTYGYLAPSMAGTTHAVKPVAAFSGGLNGDKTVKLISVHNYINGATAPGVTLQGTLMNHDATVKSIAPLLSAASSLAYTSIPFILGETNSLYNEGAPGLSNAFGAALWGLDYNLWCASQGIRRMHMHQGTNYRYASWQPVQTSKATMGTKAPYYGNIAVAAFLGNLLEHQVQVQNLPMSSEQDSAYAAYVDGKLARIAVLNMREFNSTGSSSQKSRPSQSYSFSVQGGATEVSLQRLLADGSNAISGITWDGWSYNWELSQGKPVKLSNVTVGETAQVVSGSVSVTVQDSSAVVLNFSS